MFLLEQLSITTKKIKTQLANIATLANLGAGVTAILLTLQGNTNAGLLFIIIAAMLDRLDGYLARKLNITSELGKQLDSLSDLVSFGVAPAVLIFQLSLTEIGFIGGVAVVLFITCGALRLARFNITESQNEFIGLPITAAGCLLVFFSLFHGNIGAPMYTVLMISLAGLMISNIRIKKA
ncbi:CDP-diacylglycerol--serine O-phosphatidyltransferase [Shouchella lonarensis]|uniref:CDP-diacylglycerol--serine O-phosphatidyltransferase n=1 Tax=Shouchella lonarensis TaxID=1464122 RepID=A0A1G6JID2_9BACI|nr:CDP-diacylglycerol--serine O-phosphatidyltransferase [Shouchella lonarensis]SDC18437.1 CDP-diacylglycerol---serine O-phosphatidyltransferase [Shouchella lonarensis]